MAKLSPQEAAAKWKSRTTAAAPEYTRGIQAVTTNPAQQAAAAKDKWLANIQEAAAQDRFAQGLADVTLQSWQAAATTKGAGRIAAGVSGSEGRMGQFYQGFLPAQAAVTAQTKSMPSTTLEDRINRAVQQMRGTAALKGRY